MNTFGLIGLLRDIYGSTLPDLNRIERQGLLAVKIAQHYALRPDFLDEQVCRHLARLYRHACVVPPEDVDVLLEAGTPAGWRDRFKYLDRSPLASASIGQVHRGVLTDGTEVVVKVAKKDYRDGFLRDLATVRRCLRTAMALAPRLSKVFDPMGVLRHIEQYTLAELDLRNEIRGTEVLQATARAYADVRVMSRLRLPRHFPELSGPSVLVSEFIHGETFDELLATGRLEYRQLLDLFSIHGVFLFGPGVFHGDLHPGNVLLGADGHVYLVDTGALSTVSPRIREALLQFFVVLASHDYPAAAASLHAMSEVRLDDRALREFTARFVELYGGFRGSTVAEVSLTRKMMQTIRLGVNSGMLFDSDMFGIIKSLMYLDGMVLQANPEAVLMDDVGRLIRGLRPVLASPRDRGQ